MSFGGKQSPPKPEPLIPAEPAPDRADPAVQAAAAQPRRRGRGRASTIITALAGNLPEGSAIRKTLLGGS